MHSTNFLRHGRSKLGIGLGIILLVLTVFCAIALARNIQTVDHDDPIGATAEWNPAKRILVHTPGEELFMGVIHPDAALFERAFSVEKAAKEHENFIRLLRENGATVHTVVQTLLKGTVDEKGNPLPGVELDDLRQFTARFLTFECADLPPDECEKQDDYKKKVIASHHPHVLARTILQQPTVHLSKTESNTGFAAKYELSPVMNLYFLRDQMITTAKGVVLGKMNSPQRAAETEIIRFVLRKLAIAPIAEVSGEGRLEGGDFLMAGDAAFIGQGIRTNPEALRQLLDKDAFGTRRVVAVKDSWRNQEQMHLDTYFNIIGPNLCVLEEERMGLGDKEMAEKRRLKIDVYEQNDGKYKKIISDGDFVRYLRKTMKFEIIPVTHDDQMKYGINFLTIRTNLILGIDGVSDKYKKALADHGVEATWMDFSNLTGGYGAAHCSTQVLYRAGQ